MTTKDSMTKKSPPAKKTSPTFKYLLNDDFFPLTSSIVFLKADSESAASAYEEWMKSLRRPIERTLVSGELADLLPSLLPLQGWDGRLLFVPTKSDWTACFSNCWAAGPQTPALEYLACAYLKCVCVSICAVPGTNVGKYPEMKGRFIETAMNIVDPHNAPPPLYELRSILCCNNSYVVSNWIFKTQGKELSFEKPENYSAKRVKDRFTPELLEEYLLAMGIRAFDEHFYCAQGSDATLVDCDDFIGNVNRPEPMSLEERQKLIEGFSPYLEFRTKLS